MSGEQRLAPGALVVFSCHTSLFTSHQILCRLRLLGIRGTHGLAPKSVFGNYLYNSLYFQHIFGSHSRGRWTSGRSATPGTPGAPECLSEAGIDGIFAVGCHFSSSSRPQHSKTENAQGDG